MTQPTGGITTSYGSFGSATGGFDLAYGGKNWGNFFEVDGLNTGRFLDAPGVRGLPRQGERTKCFRSRGLSIHAGRFHPLQPELQPLLVSDAQHLRQPERPKRHQRRHSPTRSSATSAIPTRGRRSRRSISRRPTPETIESIFCIQLRRLRPPRRYNYYPSENPSPIWARQSAEPDHRSVRARSPMPEPTPTISYVKGNQ